MYDIEISKVNETYIRVDSERDISEQLSETFKFEVPGSEWNPKVRMGYWDGYIRLFNTKTRQIYAGLLPAIIEFCNENNYEYVVHDGLGKEREDIPDNAGEVVAKAMKAPFEPRYYQNSVVVDALRKGRGFFICPTASGKSFMIYLITRYLQKRGKRTLIVLPSIGLVNQLSGDFKEYNNGEDFDHHVIKQGKSKDTDETIVFSTWQSIYKQPVEWFSQFDCVMGDEADEFAAKSLTGLLEKSENVPFRFGFTGTLEDTKIDRLVLEGLFGPIKQYVTTRDLMDQGVLADLTIKVLVLKHSKDTFAAMKQSAKPKKGRTPKKVKYEKEVAFFEQYEKRNKFIAKLINTFDQNAIVLFNHIEKHGDLLKPLIEKYGKETHYVHGGIDADVRNEVRSTVEDSTGAVVLGSYGTFSRGINIKKLTNLVFAYAFKSKKRVLQSIGRILRKSHEDEKVTLFDICDVFDGYETYSEKHMQERINMYYKEGFKVKIIEVDI